MAFAHSTNTGDKTDDTAVAAAAIQAHLLRGGQTPQGWILSSGDVGSGGLAVCPGGVLVVLGVVGEAAVEDPNESVAEGAECLVVEITFGSSLVIEVSASGAAGD